MREAEQEAAAEEEHEHATAVSYEVEHAGETPEERKKRKRRETNTLNRIKQSKDFSRRKARRIQELADEDDDALAREMMNEKPRPMPGQLGNCELCGKRFTVTAYSKTGPNGGFLCPKCSKDAADDEKKAKPKKRVARSGRRQLQSNLLDGVVQYGAMSLVEMCTKVCQRLLSLNLWLFALLTLIFRKLLKTSTISRNLGIYLRLCSIVSARSCPRDVFSPPGLSIYSYARICIPSISTTVLVRAFFFFFPLLLVTSFD